MEISEKKTSKKKRKEKWGHRERRASSSFSIFYFPPLKNTLDNLEFTIDLSVTMGLISQFMFTTDLARYFETFLGF